jgi:hypothetical protein
MIAVVVGSIIIIAAVAAACVLEWISRARPAEQIAAAIALERQRENMRRIHGNLRTARTTYTERTGEVIVR